MRAVRIHAYGDASVLKLEDAPLPEVEPTDVLIEVHAAAVNPADYQFRRGDFKAVAPRALPFIPGWDVAGTVVRIGASVVGVSVGEAVFAMCRMSRDGAYAEYVAVDAADVAPKPKTLSFESAAAVPLAALTAWSALVDVARVSASQHVLVHAGAGGVGSFAVQLATRLGARVAATASADTLELVASLGAEQVIDHRTEDFSALLRDLDAVLDTVGGETRERSWQTLRKGATLAAIAMPPPDDSAAQRYGVAASMVYVVPDGARLREIGRIIDEGGLKVLIDRVFPLAEVAHAHALSESRHARGKIVLTIK